MEKMPEWHKKGIAVFNDLWADGTLRSILTLGENAYKSMPEANLRDVFRELPCQNVA